MVFWGPSFLLGAAYLLVLAVYRYGWFLSEKRGRVMPADSVKVSVIVPMRNEAENLPDLMKGLLAQHYPKENLEIILVDDGSDDNSLAIAQGYAAVQSHVKVLALDPAIAGISGKKRAIEAGIAAATGDWIVCTDADCTHQPGWLKLMAGAFVSGKKFAAAPVAFRTEPDILSVFQTLDFMTLQGITAASVSLRMHSMCNGANLAYSRKAFYEVDGFKGIDKLPTGDDMLLMHKIFSTNPEGVQYIKSRETIVETHAPETWKAFFQQRIRWASKAAYYEDKKIFLVLLLVYLFNAWLMVLMAWAFFSREALNCLAVFMTGKILAELFFLWPVAGFFRKRQWLWWFPFLQPIHIIYTVIAGWLGRFGSYQWKGRTISKPSTLSAS